MSKYKLFHGDELEGKTGTQLQQAAQQIKQKFDQKRNRYHQLRNQIIIGYDWDELNEKIIDFDTNSFNPWNQKWNTIYRTNDIIQLKAFFEEGAKFFNEMDKYIDSLNSIQNNSEEIESLKAEILQHIEKDILDLKTTISSEIEKGINDLVGLKAELGLQKNFKDNIDTELETAMKFRFRFMVGFMITLLSLPIFALSTYYLGMFQNIGNTELYVLRIGITISLGLFSYFLYSQYKLYQIICLKFTFTRFFRWRGNIY